MQHDIEKGGESGLLDLNEVAGGAGGTIIRATVEHSRIQINKWRVREGYPLSTSQIILLYQVVDNDGKPLPDKAIHKFKTHRVGVVKKRLCKDGDIIEKGAPLLELSACIHTTVIKDMCANCGADLRYTENGNSSEASVPMVHSIPDLKVSQKLAQKLGHDDTRRLLQDRKLVLLVDLDQTVIHTTNDNVPNNIKGIHHFQLYGPHSPWYHTRLRPGTAEFLERMSKLYELHICTFGARNYAHMIAQLLDPNGEFFSHRILSRDECFNATSKTDNLKALFPNGDSMVCIIDDREDVWNMASNLIQVKPYHFFQHTGDINAPPGLSKHELDGEGVDFKEIANKDTNDNTKSDNKDSTEAIDSDTKAPAADSTVDKEEDAQKPEVSSSDETIKNEVDTQDTTASDVITAEATTTDVEENTSVLVENREITKENEANESNEPKEPNESNESNEPIKSNEPNESNEENEVNPEVEKVAETNEADAIPSTSGNINAQTKVPADTQNSNSQVDIEDPDDYLLYLEVILKNIHGRFYAIYDETTEIPDLKIIVPKIRSEVLRGSNLVFSGLVPTNMKLEQSRAYFIAKSLGANVSQNINEDTTHLVAVTAGTYKVNAAKKISNIKVVNANWLWSCAERWEHVEEKLFPLDRKVKGKHRQPPAHCHSPEHVVNYSDKSEISSSSSAQQLESEWANFRDTLNPLLSFTNADLMAMNKDFDQFFESDSSSEDEHVNIENPPVDKKLLKRKREDQTSERITDFFTRTEDVMLAAPPDLQADSEKSSNEEEEEDDDDDEDDEDDDEMPSAKFRRGENLPSDIEMGSDSNSENNPDTEDDGEWNMMGAALEREFLGLDD